MNPIFLSAPLSIEVQPDFEIVSQYFKTVSAKPENESYLLWDGKLFIWQDVELGALHLDWVENQADYQRKSHRGKQELIAKALGLDKGSKKILDLTLGLGQDAAFLAQLGVQVIGVERSPVLFLLLKQAQRKALAVVSWASQLEIHFADAKDFFSKIKDVDAIYIDPMFPEKKKSALPRKEMRIFRSIVGDDPDAQELLLEVLKQTNVRTVVKRPLKAPELLEKPVHSFRGTTVRYDLYRGNG